MARLLLSPPSFSARDHPARDLALSPLYAELPVIVKMQPGRSEQQKLQLTEAIVKDVMTFARVGDEAVSVSAEEIAPSDWVDKVYQPDILNGTGKLYKKPGYNPLK